MPEPLRAIMVDTKYKKGLKRRQVDVEEVVKDKHYIIYSSHPKELTRTDKMEAIMKFCGPDLTLLI